MRDIRIDRLTGQAIAYPIEDLDSNNELDSKVIEYLKNSKQESTELSLKQLHRANVAGTPTGTPVDYDNYNRKRRWEESESSEINYDEPSISISKILALTKPLYNGACDPLSTRSTLFEIYEQVQTTTANLDPVHPLICKNKNTWLDYMETHDPVPLSRENGDRVLNYINESALKTSKISDQLGLWAWSVLLRTSKPVTSREIGNIREVAKRFQTMGDSELGRAYIELVIAVFKQLDLKV